MFVGRLPGNNSVSIMIMIDNLGLLFLAGLIFLAAAALFLMVRILPGDRAVVTSKNPTGNVAYIRASYWIFFGLSLFFVAAFVIFSFDLYKFIPGFLLIQ